MENELTGPTADVLDRDVPPSDPLTSEIFRHIISDSREVIFWTDEEGNFIGCNEATCQTFGYTRAELVRLQVRDIDRDITEETHAEMLDHLTRYDSYRIQTQPKCKDGSFVAMDFVVKKLEVDGRTILYTYGRQVDLDRTSRNLVLEALAKGRPLPEILGLINRLAEKTQPGMIASILLLDNEGCLRNGGPCKLAAEYLDAIDGVRPGPRVGSCGTAVYRSAAVLVSDINKSPLWADFTEIAAMAGVAACWSEPIFSTENQVLGTLALYFKTPQTPTMRDLNLMKTYSRLASIAIERDVQQGQVARSELRNRTLVQSTASTSWTTSPEGTFIAPQESWEWYTGQTWDESRGYGWSNAIHAADRPRILKEWREALDLRDHFTTQGRMWHAKSKSFRHFVVYATPLIEGDKVIEWVGFTLDIQDRRTVEDRFLRSKAMLSQAQEVARLGSWFWDLTTDKVEWTEEFCRMTGIPVDQTSGDFDQLASTICEADRVRICELIQQVILSQQSLTMDYRIRGPNGKLKNVFSKLQLEVDSTGKKRNLIGIIQDVTDLRRTEEALINSERQLRLIANALPVLISYIDSNYRFKFSNSAYEDFFGKPSSEILGMHLEELLGKEAFQDAKPFYDEAFGGHRVTYEQPIFGPRGRERIFEVRLIPDRNLQFDVSGVYVMVDDITERRSLEREVIDIAASEHRRIGQDLHDDAGQELTGLGMVADTLYQALSRKNAKEKDTAEKLARGIKRTLKKLKTVARGLNPVDISPGGLSSAITEMVGHVQELYGIHCTFTAREEVPIVDNQVATQLFRIAQEAITNAAKHSRSSEINVHLESNPLETFLHVVDHGDGFRSNDTERRGMGLRTMRYRAGIVGGQLEIHPAANGGVEVRCRVPNRVARNQLETN